MLTFYFNFRSCLGEQEEAAEAEDGSEQERGRHVGQSSGIHLTMTACHLITNKAFHLPSTYFLFLNPVKVEWA